MHDRFTLVLVVNHACNLACRYCYTGAKFARPIPATIARHAIARAVSSIEPGGSLALGFFGGEPLLEAPAILRWIAHARGRCRARGLSLALDLTTNGTLTDGDAWEVMTDPALELAVSFDGLPELHDRHRVRAGGGPSARTVLATLRRLQHAGRAFRVVAVVRPDTAARLPDALRFLRGLGIEMVDLNLDLWTAWSPADRGVLHEALHEAAAVWRDGLPGFGVNWFNEMALRMARVPAAGTSCGADCGAQVAVAPSGRLYPCERMVREDRAGHPLAYPGHVLDGEGFFALARTEDSAEAGGCGLACRCCRFVRTGRIDGDDELLRALDDACLDATRAAIMPIVREPQTIP